MIFPLFVSIITKNPFLEKINNKLPIKLGLRPELTNCFQFIRPLFKLIENNSFLLFEIYMFFLLKTNSEFLRVNESSLIAVSCVGVCHNNLP